MKSLGGTRLSLTRALGSDFLIGTLGYSFENVGIIFNDLTSGPTTSGTSGQIYPGTPVNVPQDLLDQRGYSLISKITGSLAYDTRNSVQLPDRGQRTELQAELAGHFGGVQDYYRLELKTRWYFKGLAAGHVLELVGGTGVAEAYGSTESVPFFDRYYLGGINTLRGYYYRNVSPRQPDSPGFHSNEPIGGDTYWFWSAEYSVPIIERLRFAVFYDIGDVQLDPFSYDVSNFTSNWGLGVRLNLPIGPLRLDYGIPLRHDHYSSSSGKFQFTAGYVRPF